MENELSPLSSVYNSCARDDTKSSSNVHRFKVSSLNPAEQKACEFIGVSEGYLAREVSCHGSKKVGGNHNNAVLRRPNQHLDLNL